MYHRYPDLQAPALRQAAACLKELGDPEEARLTLRSLLKEFPDSEAARELKSLRQNGS